jgi:hypothetical protein
VSAAVTLTDTPDADGKTANDREMSNMEFAKRVWDQVNISLKSDIQPQRAIITLRSAEPKDSKGSGPCKSSEEAFVFTPAAYRLFPKGLPQSSSRFPGLYNCGSHNLRSTYSFTSLEAAVQNSVHLAHLVDPTTRQLISIKTHVRFRDFFILILLTVAVMILLSLLHFVL